MSKTVFINVTILVIALIVGLLLSEITLRELGYEPRRYETLDRAEPTMNQPDAELGWVSKAGSYKVPPYKSTSQPIKYTFYADGSRATSLSSIVKSENEFTGKKIEEVIIVGCSFSQGWAVSDGETYAWNLQRRFPDLKVLNYGTAGYGTYQSLLRLERTLPKLPAPKLVVYGFMHDHERRNVAPSDWLEMLARFSHRNHVYVPFVTLDTNGKLIRHPPQRYIDLPLHEYSAAVALVETNIMKFLTHGRSANRQEITEKLILEMEKISKAYGAKFMIALLSDPGEHYLVFSKEHNIPVANCSFPLTDDMRVKGEGHPNERAHALWAECISEAILSNKLL